ncbi:MAG: lysine--tRNA ligase [Candidatus Campbellbacteria bacterium]|nr:lysine--tRNA ligase [Candidatus Campbellbacteria bacterium]
MNDTIEPIENERETRIKKAQELKSKGDNPYKSNFAKTHFTDEVMFYAKENKLRESEDVFTSTKKDIRTAGRILAIRNHGKILFVNIQDMRGELQVFIKEDILGAEKFSFVVDMLDMGDFVGVVGEPFMTKQDKLALCVAEIELLSKAINPMPSEHFGIEDTELRYRKRYLDLILNEKSRETMRVAIEMVDFLRNWLKERDFVEVTTRVLQNLPGGANAESFVTHHNYLDVDLYLRIASELDLKMAVAGGKERVFEIGPVFRNEGIDAEHLQEYQSLEFYCAYKSIEESMEWAEDMLSQAALSTVGKKTGIVFSESGEAKTVSLDPPFRKIAFLDLMKKEGVDSDTSEDELRKKIVATGVSEKEIKGKTSGALLDILYKKTVRPNIIEPTFVTQYPVDMFPLARPNDKNEKVADSYQIVVGGVELVKAYSELIDPVVQREALMKQERARKGGDNEAERLNEEFLTAMEHGMPPMVGFGLGISRFVAVLTGTKNLKETILFPLLAPKKDK